MKEFILVNGRVILNNEYIITDIKRNEVKERGGYIGLLFGLIIISLINDFSKAELFKEVSDYADFVLKAIGLIVILYLIYHFSFKKIWSKNIAINKIKKAIVDVEKFETEVKIILSNNREKVLEFRTLENQVEPFISELKKKNSRLIIQEN